MTDIQQRASFDIIRYSNCWEDADVLLEALAIETGDNCLSVASAGDNSFSLLINDPALVVAADISTVQISLVELKRAAIVALERERFLGFAGFRDDGSDRLRTYDTLRNDMSNDARTFWDNNHELIRDGIIHAGKFERYFRTFRKWILPLVHNRRDIASLLAPKSQNERLRFYSDRWDTWRWRMMFRVFFSRFVMGRMGRDPQFFKYVDGSVAERILLRVKHALTMLEGDKNPYMAYILQGNFDSAMPHYVRAENYDMIRKRMDRLQLYCGNIEGASMHFGVRFDACNLSDIFEYMPPEQFRTCADDIIDGCNAGARLAYWNMLAPRSMSETLPHRVYLQQDLSRRMHLQDRAFFYSTFCLDKVVST